MLIQKMVIVVYNANNIIIIIIVVIYIYIYRQIDRYIYTENINIYIFEKHLHHFKSFDLINFRW